MTGAEAFEQPVRMIDGCRRCSKRARAAIRRTEEAPQMSGGRIDELHGHVASAYGALAHEAGGAIAGGRLQSNAGCRQAVIALAMKVAGITLEKVIEDLAAADSYWKFTRLNSSHI